MAVLQTVTGPTRTARQGGLSAIAEFELDPRIGATETVSWISDPCTFPQPAIGLCWETPSFPADAKTGEAIDIVDAISAPFALYGGVECFLGPDNDFDMRAQLILDQGADRALETKLVAWADDATAISSTDIMDALANVENALDAAYAGRGVILMNRGDVIRVHNSLMMGLDGIPVTTNNTPVISTSAVPAGTVLGVGAIKVVHGPTVAHGAPNERQNREMWIAEQVYVILVDCAIRLRATVA